MLLSLCTKSNTSRGHCQHPIRKPSREMRQYQALITKRVKSGSTILETCFTANHFFYKGPILSVVPEVSQLTTPTALLSINAYKNIGKRFLLQLQGRGDVDEWQADNFLLYNIQGLRQSTRQNK